MEAATVRKRFRQSFIKHLSDTTTHITRFIESRGSTSNHFGYFDVDMMKRCIELKVSMESFLKDYQIWIKKNLKNPEKHLNVNV